MKITFKIISVLILFTILFCNFSFADDYTDLLKSEITTLEAAKGDNNLNKSASNIITVIITIVRVIAIGVALITLFVLAMKYMMAAPGDKADVKKHAVPFVVGAVVLFAASGILGIIANFATATIK